MVADLTVFTKNLQALVNIDTVARRLVDAGCQILSTEIMPITHEMCTVHYAELRARSQVYYDEVQTLLDACPSLFMLVRGDIETIHYIIGEETDPKNCNTESARYLYGPTIGNNGFHRSANEEEAKRDYETFWGKNGFITKYRKDAWARVKTMDKLCDVRIRQSQIDIVITPTFCQEDTDIWLVKKAFQRVGYTIVYEEMITLSEDEAKTLLKPFNAGVTIDSSKISELLNGKVCKLTINKPDGREDLKKYLPSDGSDDFVTESSDLSEIFGPTPTLRRAIMAFW